MPHVRCQVSDRVLPLARALLRYDATPSCDVTSPTRAEYIKTKATIFDNMHAFEVFLLVVLRQYKWLASKFVDLEGKMTMAEKTELLTKRLRMTSWRADVAYAGPPPKDISQPDEFKTM